MAEAAWKPWVAGLLVVGAVAMVGRNVVSPLISRGTPSEAPAETTPRQNPSKPGLVRETSERAPDPSSADSSRLAGWIEEGDRDPFVSRVRRRQAFESGRKGDALNVSRTSEPGKIRVGAIAWGHGRMALVDGKAVGIGDVLREGTLVGILPDRLVLQGPSGDTILRFREGSTP